MSNGWDREDNELIVAERNNNPAGEIQSRPDILIPGAFYSCPTHGEIREVIVFSLDGTSYSYCTRCLHELLGQHFTPLEMVTNA